MGWPGAPLYVDSAWESLNVPRNRIAELNPLSNGLPPPCVASGLSARTRSTEDATAAGHEALAWPVAVEPHRRRVRPPRPRPVPVGSRLEAARGPNHDRLLPANPE